jgi:hypothetical protein
MTGCRWYKVCSSDSMRMGASIFAVSFVTLLGCQCQHKPEQSCSKLEAPAVTDRYYEPSHASALAFSPPIAQDEAPLDLSRADREPAAFVGYEDLIRTYIYVRTDDRWTADGNDRYERHAIIEKVGSSTR